MKKYKKVLAIENNYETGHRFSSLLPYFRENNFDIILFILGNSLKGKVSEQKGLKSKDFSHYSSSNYLKILKLEKPDAVILLSMNCLKMRSLNRCCKFLNIPVFLLHHALSSCSASTNAKRYDSRKFHIRRLKRLVSGDLLKNYFLYLKYLFITKSSVKTFLSFSYEGFLKIFFNKDYPTEDWKYSAYGVFIQSDKEKLMQHTYNTIDPNKIDVIGNYDLLQFGMKNDLFNSYRNNKFKNILYLESDCVMRTFNGNFELYYDYIFELNRIIRSNGFKLNIKFHPLSLKKGINKKLAKLKISTIRNDEYINSLKKSKFVISEASGIMHAACLTGIPVITPTIKPFSAKKYGVMIKNYPNRLSFSNFKEFEEIISSSRFKLKKREMQQWINDYAGPLPISEFPNRVLSILKKIV